MLNISVRRISASVNENKYRTFRTLERRSVTKLLLYIMMVILLIGAVSMLLPWTQNIRAKGFVTTLNPEDRPQTVQATIGGKIEKWYVREGSVVERGDTIMRISEVKEEYLDPQILDNTGKQIQSKDDASKAYGTKADNLVEQLEALENSKQAKLEQNQIKVKQVFLKIQSDSIDLVAAQTKEAIAVNQLRRTENLYNEGLKSLTDLEAKRLSIREAQAKVLEITNKLNTSKNELNNLSTNIAAIENEYNDKIAKSRSDRMSALSSKYDADATRDKLQSMYNSYEVRQKNYFITAPISGTVTQVIQSGIGEIIKGGESVVRLIPTEYKLAVETFIRPRDMPLLEIGQKARVQFDGWPAIVFSGWPNSSFGTFGGVIYAINDDISDNGKYRVLIAEDPEDFEWPRGVRIGGGANTLTLLKDVRVGYELWRQLNGFPADYYKPQKLENTKSKAPLKKVK